MKKLRNVISVIKLMICVILLLFIPLPRLALEIVFGIELLLGILLYVYSKNTFVENTQRRILNLVLIYNLMILSVSISIVRFCLISKEFPIRYISILYSLNTSFSVLCIIFSLCFFVASTFFIQKWRKKLMAKCDIFLEKQSENSDKGDIDFYSEVEGMSEFLVGNFIFSILNLSCVIIAGAFFNITMSGETFFNAIIYSIKHGVMFIFVAFLPLLLSAKVLVENLKQFEQKKMVDKISDRGR